MRLTGQAALSSTPAGSSVAAPSTPSPNSELDGSSMKPSSKRLRNVIE
ncbi:MAG: hypothetical protein KIT84_41535 [Labilithrix sp.]|nr:hypothetical protein [Labilithrix sp.]MCW5817555.1 hypothetical protein [Labilithrix sp.]